MRHTTVALLLVLSLMLSGCSRPRTYPIEGKVVAVDKGQRTVTIAHREIAGYMTAMTMPFAVKDAWALSVLMPGQSVRATLFVDSERSWVQDMVITQPGGAAADEEASEVHEPKPGDEVPDFKLINQDGKEVHFRQYRGKALLLTFIYTRCPLPDYCPKLTRNFKEIATALKADKEIRDKAHLLSISFDPAFDTPGILREYGERFAGNKGEGFKTWEFASAGEFEEAARFFGCRYWRESGQIIHSMSTALISPDGRLARLYRGNEWTPQEVLSELRKFSGH